MNKKITSLNTLSDHYFFYLIDIVGVICDGKNPYPQAIKAINALLRNNKTVIFLSNNPRPSSYVKNTLQHFGLQGHYHIITSGDVLHHTLATHLAQKKIYHLGRNRQHALLEGTNAHITPHISQADAIIVSCFVEQNENLHAFDKDLQDIFMSGKPVYCPNPDRLTFEGTLLRYPSGYFAHKLEQLGCPVVYLGKPSPIIYNFITYLYPHLNLQHKNTLMIGDTMETDIWGAITFNIDSLLILDGISGLHHDQNSTFLKKYHYKPTYIMNALQ